MDRKVEGWMGEWVGGWMDGWLERVDRWYGLMDRQVGR